jgi:hypothetical protein
LERLLNVDSVASQIRTLEDQEVSRQSAFVEMIQDLVTSRANPNDPNTLVIAAEGFSAEPERYLRELLSSAAGARVGATLSAQDSAPTRSIHLLVEIERLATSLQERRVTTYVLVPRSESTGLGRADLQTTGGGRGTPPREDVSLAESEANAAKLADSTGGLRIPIFSDLDERIEAIILDGSASYSLGFATGAAAGFESHRIRISTSRPGISLRYRASYRRRSPQDQRREALTAAARSGIANSAIPLRLRVDSTAVGPATSARIRRIPMVLEIPLAKLDLQPALDSGYSARSGA